MVTSQKYFNNLRSVCPQNEVSMFMSILYHDGREGLSCVGTKSREGFNQLFQSTNKTSKTNLSNRNINYYTSLNTFSCGKRKQRYLYNKSVFYIDIDLHGNYASVEDFNQVTSVLTQSYENGDLNIPTAIVFTGRGLGIYYILEKSINCNIEKTKKMLFLFDLTYKKLVNKYESALSTCKNAEVDKSVLDGSRIARIPSTINTNNQKHCHLVFLNKNKNGEVNYIKNFKDICTVEKNEPFFHSPASYYGKNDSNTKVYSDSNTSLMLQQRINKLFKLAELRKYSDSAYRELTLHLAYNFAIQANYSESKANGLIVALNRLYDHPLPLSELKAATNGITKEHTYNYTTKQILEKLCISEKENQEVGFSTGTTRIIFRAQKKHDMKIKIAERNYEIANYILKHPDIKIIDIADLFSVSRTTVNNIIKEYGVNRNQCLNSTLMDPESIQKQKVQKIDTILWCVCNTPGEKGNYNTKNTNKENYNKGIIIKEHINKENHKESITNNDTLINDTLMKDHINSVIDNNIIINKENCNEGIIIKGHINKENHKESITNNDTLINDTIMKDPINSVIDNNIVTNKENYNEGIMNNGVNHNTVLNTNFIIDNSIWDVHTTCKIQNEDIMNDETKLMQYINYDFSFLDYLIAHTVDHHNIAFRAFIEHFDKYLCYELDNNTQKSEFIIKAIHFVGHIFETEPVIEKAIKPLSNIFTILHGNTELSQDTIITMDSVFLEEITVDTILNTQYSHSQFRYIY